MSDAPLTIEQLGQMFGPSIGYLIGECRVGGGFIVCVDGAPYGMRTLLHEAITLMADVAANKYAQSAIPPERASNVTPSTTLAEDDRSLDDGPRIVRPYAVPPASMPTEAGGLTMRLRNAASVLAFALVLLASATMLKV